MKLLCYFIKKKRRRILLIIYIYIFEIDPIKLLTATINN
jgi:hypothetical protein